MTANDRNSTDRIVTVQRDATGNNWCVFRADAAGRVDRLGELHELRREAFQDADQQVLWGRAARRVTPRRFSRISSYRRLGFDIYA